MKMKQRLITKKVFLAFNFFNFVICYIEKCIHINIGFRCRNYCIRFCLLIILHK